MYQSHLICNNKIKYSITEKNNNYRSKSLLSMNVYDVAVLLMKFDKTMLEAAISFYDN